MRRAQRRPGYYYMLLLLLLLKRLVRRAQCKPGPTRSAARGRMYCAVVVAVVVCSSSLALPAARHADGGPAPSSVTTPSVFVCYSYSDVRTKLWLDPLAAVYSSILYCRMLLHSVVLSSVM